MGEGEKVISGGGGGHHDRGRSDLSHKNISNIKSQITNKPISCVLAVAGVYSSCRLRHLITRRNAAFLPVKQMFGQYYVAYFCL